MKKYLQHIINHPLISGSAAIVIGTLLANVVNFLFNVFMTRNLTVADYGTFASLVALITLITLPAGSIIPTIVQFAATYLAKNEKEKLEGFYFHLNRFFLLVGVLLFLIMLLFAPMIGEFFKIDEIYLITVASIAIVVSYLNIVNAGILQAQLAFIFMTLTNIVSTLGKLILGILLVFVGVSVSGAIVAYTFAFVFYYVVTLVRLRSFISFTSQKSPVSFGELTRYGAPTAVAMFCVNSLISTDVLLVKHFYSPKEAGIYAGLALVGKIVFLLSSPIGTVMFPLIVQKYMKGENYKSVFHLSLFLVLIPSLLLTIFYFFFSEFTVSIFNKEYVNVAWLLGYFGIFISAYSLLYLVTNCYLSIKKTKVAIPLAVGSVVQVILLWFFHDTFLQVILISLAITTLLLLSLLLYLELYEKKQAV